MQTALTFFDSDAEPTEKSWAPLHRVTRLLREAGRIRNIDVSVEVSLQGIVEQLIRARVDFIRPSGTKVVLVIVPLANEGLIQKLEKLGFKKRFFADGMFLQ